MQANLELKLKPVEEMAALRSVPRQGEGKWVRFNRAVSKFVAFHNDGALRGIDSPYRWIQEGPNKASERR